MLEGSCLLSAGVPNPLIATFPPAPAKARAHANPMPLVDPVTTADLPVSVPISNTPAVGRIEWRPWAAGTHGRTLSRSRCFRFEGAALDVFAISGGRCDPPGHHGSWGYRPHQLPGSPRLA